MRLFTFLLASLLLCGLSSFGSGPDGNKGLKKKLHEIAQEYREYGPMSERFREAPAACAAPEPMRPVSEEERARREAVIKDLERMHQSLSGDEGSHGRKLYKLFVRDYDAYVTGIDEEQPIGQVLVKESWASEELLPGQGAIASEAPAVEGHPEYTKGVVIGKDGDAYRATKPTSLFIMYKDSRKGMDEKNTDNGWVYAVTSLDGSEIMDAGRIESCMGCHLEAPYDRVFGFKKDSKD